jgi:CheY-like chemotaxis protein
MDTFFISYPRDPDNPALFSSGSPALADTPGTRTTSSGNDTSGRLSGLLLIGSGAVLLVFGVFAAARLLKARPRNVLVVDDNADIVDVISIMLRKDGYTTRTANGGEQCLRELESAIPDLILLDIGMEPMDGWETLRRIKKNPATRGVMVIMLTSRCLTPKDVEDYAICIEDYIVKPVTMQGLKDAISHVFARQQMIHEKIALVKGTGINRNELCECARLTRVVDVNKRLWDQLVRTYTMDEGTDGVENEMTRAIKNTKRKIRDQECRLEQIRRNLGSGT